MRAKIPFEIYSWGFKIFFLKKIENPWRSKIFPLVLGALKVSKSHKLEVPHYTRFSNLENEYCETFIQDNLLLKGITKRYLVV